MLTRDITYTNLDDKEVTRKFYFNMTEAELVELETSFGNIGLVESMNRIVEAQDVETMMKEFKRIILMTYGVRDGDDFMKSEEQNRRFEGSNAYSALFMEFLTVEGALAEFIQGVMPKNGKVIKEEKSNLPPPPSAFDVAKITDQQKAIGQQIVEGTANG